MHTASSAASDARPSPKDLSELSDPLAVAFKPEAPRPAAVAATRRAEDIGAPGDSEQEPAPESEVRIPCPVPRPPDSCAVLPGGSCCD